MINLKEMTLRELEHFFQTLDEPRYRAKQVFRWIYKGVSDFNSMTDLPKSLVRKLRNTADVGSIKIYKSFRSKKDGTVKYIFSLGDGNLIEGVKMVHPFGLTGCISTQVGCPMGCVFCASTKEGLIRNLYCGEMADQIICMEEDSGRKISRVVLMGSGEPFLNYKEVIKFIHLLNNPDAFNISLRRIAVSTCGIVPKIKAFADEQLPVTLAVSLHAPEDALRSEIMPVNRNYPIGQLLDACKYYIIKTKRRVTFEYALISGLNDSKEYAHKLANLLKGLLCHVNLIPMNSIDDSPFASSDEEQVRIFEKILLNNGICATVRKEMGSDINAACGQLRHRMLAR